MESLLELDNVLEALKPDWQNSGEAAQDLEEARAAIVHSSLTGQVHDFLDLNFPVHRESLSTFGVESPPLPSTSDILASFEDEESIPVRRIVTRNWGSPISINPLVSSELGAGQAPISVLGPFRDAADTQVGVSVFAAITFSNLQRAGSTTPFFYFQAPALWPGGGFTTLNLGEGSIWIPAQQFISSAPDPGFVGLKIKSATLSFSDAVTRTSITAIPVGVRIIVNLTLADITAEKTLWSEDLKTPTNAQFVFNANSSGIQLSSAAPTSIKVLGSQIELRRTGQSTRPDNLPSYDGLFGRINLPFVPNQARVPLDGDGINGKILSLTSEAGSVDIISASWSLPINNTSPDTLGEASGAGGVTFSLAPGLLCTTGGIDDQLFELDNCTLIADSSASVLGGDKGHSTSDQENTFSVYGEFSTVKYRPPADITFRAISASSGVETWAVVYHLKISLDQPRTVNNERLLLEVPQGALVLTKPPTSLGQPDPNIIVSISGSVASLKKQYSFALKNLFFKTDAPQSVYLGGSYTKNPDGIIAMISGSITLSLPMRLGFPFLPDPYTTNWPSPDPNGNSGGTIGIKLTWDKPEVSIPIIDISIGTNQNANSNLISSIGPSEVRALDSFRSPALLDLSTNASQFGVAINLGSDPGERPVPIVPIGAPTVEDLFVRFPGRNMTVIALPAVQWEPVYNRRNPDTSDTFPRMVTWDNSGTPTSIGAQMAEMVPLAPRNLLDGVLSAYNRAPATAASEVAASITLPFGIDARVRLVKSHIILLPSPVMTEVRPKFKHFSTSSEGLRSQIVKGSDQYSLRAPRPRIVFPPGGTDTTSPSFSGDARILLNAISVDDDPDKVSMSAWGSETHEAFNTDFKTSVPVTRVDITGFGESIYSDWRRSIGPSATSFVSKVLLEAMVGRAQKGEIQTYRECYPFAFGLIRTIDIERGNLGPFTRWDSGWQPVSTGRYRFANPSLVTHPGIVTGVQDVTNVRDGPVEWKITLSSGIVMAAVIFDCNVNIQNVISGGASSGVPARNLVGYVQVSSTSTVIQPPDYADLLNKAQGRICGLVNCAIDVANTGMEMHLRKVLVKSSINDAGTQEFVMGAYGSLDLQGPGVQQWSFVQMPGGNASSAAEVGEEGVPLIRLGPVSSGTIPSLPTPPPYRFSDPARLYSDSPTGPYYGLIHATGSQRILFPRLKIESDGNHQFTSTDPPFIADMYALATSTGPFPFPSVCIPFNDASFRLEILHGGHLILHQPKMTIPTSLAPRQMLASSTMTTTIVNAIPDPNNENSVIPSEVTVVIDTTSQTLPWAFEITNISIVHGSTEHQELVRVTGDIFSNPQVPTRFNKAALLFGPPLKPATDVVAFLSKFGPLPPWEIAMQNEFSVTAKKTFELGEYLSHLIPPLGDFVEQFVEDLSFGFELFTKTVDADMVLEGGITLKFTTPSGVIVICLANVKFEISSTSPDSWEFQVGGGAGLGFTLPGGFKVLGYIALAADFEKTASSIALGASIIIRGGIDLKVISAEVETEAKFIYKKVKCHGGTASTVWGYSQVSIGVDISICWIIDIEFEVSLEWKRKLEDGPCDFDEGS